MNLRIHLHLYPRAYVNNCLNLDETLKLTLLEMVGEEDCVSLFFLLGALEGLAGKRGGVLDELVGFEAFEASGRIFLFRDIVVDFFRPCYQKDIINWFFI